MNQVLRTQAQSGARAIAWLARGFAAELAELDLSLPQFRLLGFLDHGDWAASALADRLSVSKPSLTSLADGLVSRGLIERRQAEDDRRRVLHVLTDEGRRLLAAADTALDAHLDAMLDRLPPGRRKVAVAGLDALGEALDEARRERWGR